MQVTIKIRRPALWVGIAGILLLISWYIFAGGSLPGMSTRLPDSLQDMDCLLLGRVHKIEQKEDGEKIYLQELVVLPQSQQEMILRDASQIVSKSSLYASKFHFSFHKTDTITSNIDTIFLSEESYTTIEKNLSELLNRKDQLLFRTEEETELEPGDFCLLNGRLSLFEAATNPGQFDTRAYYRTEGVCGYLNEGRLLFRQPGASFLSGALYRLKKKLLQSLKNCYDVQEAGLMAAVLFGEKAMLDSEWKKLFQNGGLAHILVISGLHISFLGLGIYKLLRRCCRSIPTAGLLSCGILFYYLCMIGFPTSAQRAFLMFILSVIAAAFGRGEDRLSFLAISAVCCLLLRPVLLLTTSFQLSFSALFFLEMGQKLCRRVYSDLEEESREEMPEEAGKVVHRKSEVETRTKFAEIRKKKSWNVIRKKIGQKFLPGLSLFLGMLPINLYYYYQIAPWSLAANALAIPCMSLLLEFGLLGSLCGIGSVQAGVLLSAPCHYLLLFLQTVCKVEALLPGNLLVAGRPSPGKLLLYYLILAFVYGSLFRERRRGIKKVCWQWTGLVCCLLLLLSQRQRNCAFWCLDVGQGDACVLELSDGEVFVIDGGSTSETEVWKYRISTFLKYQGISRIDGWVITHSDQDHISGLEEYLQDCSYNLSGKNQDGITVKSLILPLHEEEKLDLLEKKALIKNISVLEMEAGDLLLGKKQKWSLTCLSPARGKLIGDANQDSLVLLLEDEFRVLLTGDLEKQGETLLTESGQDLTAEVLKVGHHGSRYATQKAFLQQVNPSLAVISCAMQNSYGHPAAETLQRLEDAGAQILGTLWSGAICIYREKGSGKLGVASTGCFVL